MRSDKNLKSYTMIALMSLTFAGLTAQTSYGWRGLHRDGIYPETGLLKTWPAEGPTLLWETLDVGKGYSSPTVVDEKIYITGMNEDETKEIFSAYTLDGKRIYSVEYSTPWDDSYPETRTTPTITGNRAYLISGSGEIVCINIADGSMVWKVNGGRIFARKTGNWGTSECPLVFDNKVIYTPAGDQTTMVALNAQTGETVWKSETLRDEGAYVSPILVTWNGKRQIIGSTGISVIGVNPETGHIEWSFRDWDKPSRPPRPGQPASNRAAAPESKIAPNTPIFKDGRVFFSQGYDVGGYMLQLNEAMTAATLLWKTEDLDTHHGHQVLLNGILYGSNWINNNQGNWLAVDWNTGKTLYNTAWSGGKGKGSIIAADGMLYCYDERRGAVGLVKANPARFDIVSEFRITKGEGPYWAHPVIDNGVLYLRHGNFLGAYKIK
ncbi:MAG: PQQ-binding-like beta-propeller repeat protein [Prevotellaceae bacterium]|jgi:outer membrane protein assembly factor BamB|nr:PQQ-binding-like beta-propeller repeat protein [Prevotellaceae bacterium]